MDDRVIFFDTFIIWRYHNLINMQNDIFTFIYFFTVNWLDIFFVNWNTVDFEWVH